MHRSVSIKEKKRTFQNHISSFRVCLTRIRLIGLLLRYDYLTSWSLCGGRRLYLLQMLIPAVGCSLNSRRLPKHVFNARHCFRQIICCDILILVKVLHCFINRLQTKTYHLGCALHVWHFLFSFRS